MGRFMFSLDGRGGLGVQHLDGWSLYLWPDEVQGLRALLDRPTPAEAIGRLLSSPQGVQVSVTLFPDGRLCLYGYLHAAGRAGLDMDQATVAELRAELGITARRAPEPADAVSASMDESYGPAAERLAIIAKRAALAAFGLRNRKAHPDGC